MKKLSYFWAIIILAFSINTQAQIRSFFKWIDITSGVNSDLHSVYLSNYITGKNGVILKSTNTGAEWYQIPSGVSNNLFAISGALPGNSQRLTCVGSGGLILKSDDFGETWTSVSSNTTKDLFCVTSALVSSPLTIKQFAGGAEGTFLSCSYLPGFNWTPWTLIDVGTTKDIKSVFFLGKNGWIAGSQGLLKRTTNMGDNWINAYLPLTTNFNSVFFTDTLKGWVTGDNGIILRTTNGGASWFQTESYAGNNLNSFSPYYIAGSNGTLLKSNNSGLNWIAVNSLTTNDLFCISGESFRIAAGSGGKILRGITDSSFSFTTSISNSRMFIWYDGINQKKIIGNQPGLEWPSFSNKSVIFTLGLTIAGIVNNQLRMSSAMYTGEYAPGYIELLNGIPIPKTDDRFRFYKINKGDGPTTNRDWILWGDMVPYGAPFIDVNHNNIYEPMIDTPGVRNAKNTTFICMTDGFDSTHRGNTGFGGGTLPLYSEIHWTNWCYEETPLEDIQYSKYEIINKYNFPWNSVFFSICSDPDVGNSDDDFIGCDNTRNLGFAYNGDNNDPIYGTAPPAVGIRILKGASTNNLSLYGDLRMTAFNQMKNLAANPPYCESDPYGEPSNAYNFMKGYKKDGTPWVIANTNPPVPTKFIFSGDPETASGPLDGWSVNNCGGSLYGQSTQLNPGDRRLLIHTGSTSLTVLPGTKQTIVIAQVVARGSNNLNSVTKVKQLSDVAYQYYYENVFPLYSVSGNVRFADNQQSVNNGYVIAVKLDPASGKINIIDSAGISTNGNYELHNMPSEDVYIGAYPNSSGNPPDFVPGYHPSGIGWQNAVIIKPTSNLTNINISVERTQNYITGNNITGYVKRSNNIPLEDAIIYAKSGNNFAGFGISNQTDGYYFINSLPAGQIKLIIHRLGFYSDSTNIFLTSSTNQNFILEQSYVGIIKTQESVPNKYFLSQNYPNPFNPETKIKFGIPHGSDKVKIQITIYNILGEKIETLADNEYIPGIYETKWNGMKYPSGIYFCRLKAENYSHSVRMLLIK